jgi:hypothetical protein
VRAVLHLALTYFSIVPLQKWVSIAGMALFAATLLVPSPAFSIAAILGAVFVVITPVIVGGTAMRFGSSHGTLQLRPGGRWKMLAAALLAVCLMTAIYTLAMWAAMRSGLGPPRRNPLTGSPVTLTGIAVVLWSAYSLCWLATFAASASRTWGTVMVVVVIAAINSRYWEPLQTLGPRTVVLPSIAAIWWLAFAAWYLRAPRVRRPGWSSISPLLTPGGKTAGGWYGALMDARGESRTVAVRAYLLGTSSRAGFLLPGVIAALVIMLMHQLLQRTSPDGDPLPVVFVNVLAWIAASLASVVARRARMLWLRAGLDRAGLFALGERTALHAAGLMILSAAVMLTAYSIAVRPDLAIRILVYVISQLVFSTGLLYFGLSLTRGWTVADTFGGICMGLLWIVQMIVLLPQNTIDRPVVTPVVMGISLVLALALRLHARRRWLSVDWHLTRPVLPRYAR